MNSNFRLPLFPFRTNMPIISQRIRNKVPISRNSRIANRNWIITKGLNFAFRLMIPKMHGSISSWSREPFVEGWVKSNRIDWKQDYIFLVLCLMGFESYMGFLNLAGKITTLYSKLALDWMNDMFTRPSIVPSPKFLPSLLT